MTDGGSLAIDAGQSGIKVRHADAAGASEWSGPGIRTDLPLLPQIPLSVRSAESAAERTSVLHYMPRSPVATAYRAVATWIDDPESSDPPVPPALFASEELHV